MTKTEILAEIEALASARLFGTGPWLADEETAGLLNKKFSKWVLRNRCREKRIAGEIRRSETNWTSTS